VSASPSACHPGKALDPEATSVLRVGKDLDALGWWHQKKDQFPTLFKQLEQRLCVPAASAASERLWSLVSRVIKIRRARLKAKIVADIVFLKQNSAILQRHHFAVAGVHGVLPNVHKQEENEMPDKEDGDGNGALLLKNSRCVSLLLCFAVHCCASACPCVRWTVLLLKCQSSLLWN
jgi:hypothetical protein